MTFVVVQFAYKVSAANGHGAYGKATRVDASFRTVVQPLKVKLDLVGAVGSVTKLWLWKVELATASPPLESKVVASENSLNARVPLPVTVRLVVPT